MKFVCVDACFLIGLYDPKDQHHEAATAHFSQLFDRSPSRMVIPWPILFETFSTRMVKNRSAMLSLEKDWERLRQSDRLQLISDVPYRERVVRDCFDEVAKPDHTRRGLSSVDRIVRNMLADRRNKIDAFVTFNARDFKDVCGKFRRELFC